VTGTLNTSTNFTNVRRIAGSDGAGISPGVGMMPWQGGHVSLALNYDNVRYDNKYVNDENAVGFGGTAGFNQALTDNVDLGLTATVRKPFNNYAANLSWTNVPYLSGSWALGLFGDYTAGKNTLPNTWNVGLSADYSWDRRCSQVPANLKGEANFKGEAIALQPVNDKLLSWTADPAVYMPQVLAIVDEKVIKQCAVPVKYIGPNSTALGNAISAQIVNSGTHTYNFGPDFTGTPLVYSIQLVSSVPGSSPISPTINSQTGAAAGLGGECFVDGYSGGNYNITVTATGSNGCGSASINFTFEQECVGVRRQQ
jgi:hypothetical protein